MTKVYGIDLGTTYSAIATLNESGMPEVIENFADGKHVLASAVYFPEGKDPVIGEAAKNQLEVEADKVVQFVKREIGKSDAQKRDFNGVIYDPITISSLILKRMAEYAQEQGHEVKDVVITCPAYFGNEERNATRQAGQIAGLNVLNIVNEPTAAAFNYLSREFKESRKIMVYDLGGGTFDITLFDFSVEDDGKTTIDVIRSGGDDKLGGADWDARLFNYIADLYVEENGINRDVLDGDLELKQKLRTFVETTKVSLTGLKTKSFTINHDGDSTRLEVTREKFEEITNDLVERTINYVRELLSTASVDAGDVDIVLLVGGSTKMPMIKEAVEKIFPGKTRFEDPDLAVAKGAALAAATEYNERIREFIAKETGGETTGESQFEDSINTISDENAPKTVDEARSLMINVPKAFSEGSTVIDRLSRSFGPAILAENGELMIDNLLFLGDESPSTASNTYGTIVDNQSVVELDIYENVAEDRENRLVTPCYDIRGNEQSTDPALLVKSIGKIILELPPNTPKGSPIEVTFRCYTGGLQVIARNPATGQSVETVITSENTKTQDEMDEAIKRFATIRTSGDY